MPCGVDGYFKLLRFALDERLKVYRGCAEGSPLKGEGFGMVRTACWFEAGGSFLLISA